ncbi:MAG: DUF6599 family protein [Planctomycetota bacterium]
MTWKLLPVALAVSLSIGGGCHPRPFAMQATPAFPAEANGWTLAGKPQAFDRGTLYDYMDGAGEHYLGYDFQRLHVQEYRRPDAPRIVAEAYEMQTSEDAYGVFSHDPTGEDAGIGQASTYGAGLLRFWQGAWFFRILAERETPAAKQAVLAIGRALAAPIEDGPLPPILQRLPAAHRDPASVRYFHTAFSLSTIHYLADANLLDLSPRTEAVFAAYRRGGGKPKLLIVRYKNPDQAQGAYGRFNRVYLKNLPAPSGTRAVTAIEGGTHVGVLVRGRFVALVLDAPSQNICDQLLGETARNLGD